MIPLSGVPEGKTGIVKSLEGGHGIVQRLAEMGIYAGVEVRVVRGGGPVILESRGHRLVIGRGMVERIMVEVIEP